MDRRVGYLLEAAWPMWVKHQPRPVVLPCKLSSEEVLTENAGGQDHLGLHTHKLRSLTSRTLHLATGVDQKMYWSASLANLENPSHTLLLAFIHSDLVQITVNPAVSRIKMVDNFLAKVQGASGERLV